ncbi:MAG: four-carbon acid sugar kinase family protein [Micropruina sp.]
MRATELLRDLPPECAEDWDSDLRDGRDRVLVAFDDDPTGTQSVRDLPVLTSWSDADLDWALAQHSPAIYVVTNTRSLAPDLAAARVREVAERTLAAARRAGIQVTLVARGDSTLRGHHPLETDTLAAVLAEAGEGPVDLTVLVPAFPAAGRVTVGGIHYCVADGEAVPVGESEFARDATFGFRSSGLPDWVAEKTGRATAPEVITVLAHWLRTASLDEVDSLLLEVPAGAVVAPDVASENDLRAIARAVRAAERAGRRVVLRVGPPFARAYIGQQPAEPLSPAELPVPSDLPEGRGGLIVVGSHVDLTQRQLAVLRAEHPGLPVFEIDVTRVTGGETGGRDHVDGIVAALTAALEQGDAVLQSSRTLIRGTDADDSLRIAREVSGAMSEVVSRAVAAVRPRFVIAKGGITSSDTARYGLEIHRAQVTGSLFPGLVSVWLPVGGPADGVPYIVFAGNVGDDRSLAEAVDRFHATRTPGPASGDPNPTQ